MEKANRTLGGLRLKCIHATVVIANNSSSVIFILTVVFVSLVMVANALVL